MCIGLRQHDSIQSTSADQALLTLVLASFILLRLALGFAVRRVGNFRLSVKFIGFLTVAVDSPLAQNCPCRRA